MNGLNDIVGQDTKEAGRWFSRPNLLINPDFTDPVNQQGQKKYNKAGQYTIDGWRNARNGTVEVAEGSIILRTNSEDGGIWFYQSLVNYKKYVGKIITASFLYEFENDDERNKWHLNIIDGKSTNRAFISKTTEGPELLTTSFVSAPDATEISFAFINTIVPDGEYPSLKLIAGMVEEGPTQTLAHKENGVWVQNRTTRYGDELRRCQEQYINTTSDPNSPYALQAVNSYTLFGSVTFPVEMRITPVMRNLTLRRVADGTIIQTTSAVLQGGPKGLYAITGIQPANLVVGEWYQLMCEFDARL